MPPPWIGRVFCTLHAIQYKYLYRNDKTRADLEAIKVVLRLQRHAMSNWVSIKRTQVPFCCHIDIDIIVRIDDDSSMRYPGGKGKCFQHLINLMPPHHTYIETHLGGGAVLRNKKPARRNIGIDIDPAVIAMWDGKRGDRLEIVQGDALDYLSRFQFDGGELAYFDPPYFPATRARSKVYRFDYTEAQHEALLKIAIGLPCMVMISGYDNPLYRDYLRNWNQVNFSAKSHTGVREENVWFNFAAPAVLHDANHAGATFRDRQSIKRKRARLQDRIRGMDPIERNEFIRWLTATFGTVSGGA